MLESKKRVEVRLTTYMQLVVFPVLSMITALITFFTKEKWSKPLDFDNPGIVDIINRGHFIFF